MFIVTRYKISDNVTVIVIKYNVRWTGVNTENNNFNDNLRGRNTDSHTIVPILVNISTNNSFYALIQRIQVDAPTHSKS